VPSPLPIAEVAPEHGRLPDSVAEGADKRALGLYVHVPFCEVRCGYCDFNTYTADEVRGVSRDSYPSQAMAEMELASGIMRNAGLPPRPLQTIFFGGGTPTLLGPEPLLAMLERARSTFGVAPEAEITVEANPDSVSANDLRALARGGVTRVSFGVQSADPDVLAVLERTHDPALVPEGVAAAKDAGLKVSVDVIYGSPGETVRQWESTLEYVVGLDVEHVSAYALIVEPGTALARRIARGELESPDDDVHADMFLATDRRLTEAGFAWYETSNWSTARDRESAHNWLYWNSGDWWGIGPGAHSHMGGVRWWNVKHPAAYAERLAQQRSPAFHREVLTPSDIALERILLGLRTREGISVEDVAPEKSDVLDDALGHGLLDAQALSSGRITLTQSGRLLADHLAARLS